MSCLRPPAPPTRSSPVYDWETAIPAKTQSSPYAQEGWSFSGTALPLNCAVPVALPGRRPWKTGPRNEVERSTSGPLATLPSVKLQRPHRGLQPAQTRPPWDRPAQARDCSSPAQQLRSRPGTRSAVPHSPSVSRRRRGLPSRSRDFRSRKQFPSQLWLGRGW